MAYNFDSIELQWQERWQREGTFCAREDSPREKYYCLEMFPYPSGRIHMGHVRNYSIGDVIARYKKMKGFEVLHPMGWDSLGLPAENAAKERGVHPQDWTLSNIEHMRAQLRRMGFGYDWDREVTTCLPDYYRWNQYIFIKMFEKGLAYKKASEVNWCPDCQTVLANEQVENGACWRCEAHVEVRNLEQWFLRITDYADALLEDHHELGKWPSQVLVMQENWIGKSYGAMVSFPLADSDQKIDIFTTRLDTIYGCTFFAMSVKHPLVDSLLADHPQREAALEFVREVERDRLSSREETEKKGFFTGKYAINPFNGERVPIWLANFVLMDYGTGAIMSVPAHDGRDFEFAQKYGLPVREVIVPTPDTAAQETIREVSSDRGFLIQSGSYNGLSSDEAVQRMGAFLNEKGLGELRSMIRLRDWGVSRQRYWGTPIPMVYCDSCGVVPEKLENLPVLLPKDVEFSYEGGSPLEKHSVFKDCSCPRCGAPARRETDTMDTFFDSSWYFFRYCGRHDTLPFDPQAAARWMPADLYIGGIEHAILHLIYARFFCKLFRDFGWTDQKEPFPHLLTQGMVTLGGSKMSKSKGNVVDPDALIKQYGADTARLFVLFAAPPEKSLEWSDKGVEGCHRFLQRIWAFAERHWQELSSAPVQLSSDSEIGRDLLVKLHKTVKKVSEDIEERFHLNTAIAAMMEFFNQLNAGEEALAGEMGLVRHALEILLRLLSPFTPHFANELWSRLGHDNLLENESWPEYNQEMIDRQMVNVMVQINGKIRDKLVIAPGLEEAEVSAMAQQLDKVRSHLDGKTVVKIIYIADKMLSYVVK